MEGVQDVLAMSSAEHLPDTHEETEEVMLLRPVVHWQLVSDKLQPAAGTAVAKHVSCVLLAPQGPSLPQYLNSDHQLFFLEACDCGARQWS